MKFSDIPASPRHSTQTAKSQTVVHIIGLDDLCRAIIRGQSAFYGRRPARIIACPQQVNKWGRDVADKIPPSHWVTDSMVDHLNVLGVPIYEGDADQQPELIWATPFSELI